MKFSCQKTYKVEYAHQLYTSYTSLCHETIHGHSGKIEIEFENSYAALLNGDEMVIDFGEISANIKKHIMEKYDHALFMPAAFGDEYLSLLKKYNKRLTITDVNPTAEKFAEWIFEEVDSILKKVNPNVQVVKVNFWETETGKATFFRH